MRLDRFSGLCDRYRHLIVGAFFASVLLIGIIVYRDFGLSWDEHIQWRLGQDVWQYITQQNDILLTRPNAGHGPLFTTVAYMVQVLLGIEEMREVFFLRHLLTFLLFITGVFAFYKIAAGQFDDWKWGLLSALLLLLSPRILGHAFFNPKDLPLLSLTIISIWTLIRFLDSRSDRWILPHALCSALVVSMRIQGLIIPAFTIAFLLLEGIRTRNTRREWGARIVVTLTYCFVFYTATVILWPVLWQHPLKGLLDVIAFSAQYPWPYENFYFGQYVKGILPPWHYIPVWIGITTPAVYLVCAACGSGWGIARLLQRPSGWTDKQRNILLFLCWFAGPVIAVIVFHSTVYNGWRHLFYVYPALILLVVVGWQWIRRQLQRFSKRIAQIATMLFALYLCHLGTTIVRMHPYQHVYFNEIIGGLEGAHTRFDVDYWALGVRELLERMATTLPKGTPVHPPSWGFRKEQLMATPFVRNRLIFTDTKAQARYFIGVQPRHRYSAAVRIYDTLQVNGVPILTVYEHEPTQELPETEE